MDTMAPFLPSRCSFNCFKYLLNMFLSCPINVLLILSIIQAHCDTPLTVDKRVLEKPSPCLVRTSLHSQEYLFLFTALFTALFLFSRHENLSTQCCFSVYSGPSDSDNFTDELRGVIPRSFEYLFSLINKEVERVNITFHNQLNYHIISDYNTVEQHSTVMGRSFFFTFVIHNYFCPFRSGQSKSFLCKCSFIEIYNEQIYDLLDSASATLFLRENIKKGVFVEGAVEKFVTSASEAYQVRILKRTSGFPESTRDVPVSETPGPLPPPLLGAVHGLA